MQFLVYLTVLMVSVSTVLLEIHWLTTPPPQPKPIVRTAAAPSPAKPEGPNPALSPIYPKKSDTPQPAESASMVEAEFVGAQKSQAAPTDTSPSSIPAAAPPQNTPAETTGVATREEGLRQAEAGAMTANRAAERQEPVAVSTSPNNRCDIQACANAYQSFRASDCTYQPFEGARRFCLRPSGQQMARDQRERERRKWSRDVESRSVYRSTAGRRLDDDVDDEDDRAGFNDSARDAPTLFFFSRRPW
ncbi:MAG: BA14K family protein [Pseudolabrys sp.]